MCGKNNVNRNNASQNNADFVFTGAENLIHQNVDWKSKKIGVLSNSSVKNNNNISTINLLIKNKFNLVKLFTPEHGLTAKNKDGKLVQHRTYKNIHVISLYNFKLKIPKRIFKNIDYLLVDLPNIGVRFYTYTWTLYDCLNVLNNASTKIIILDRPNLRTNNLKVMSWNFLNINHFSFLSRASIPIVHPFTLGELSIYFKNRNQLNIHLDVVKFKNRTRNKANETKNENWTKPSPALVNYNSCFLYPALCLFEATNISIARNSKYSFQWIGGPQFPCTKIIAVLNKHFKNQIDFQTKTILMSSENKRIKGIFMTPKNLFFDMMFFGCMLLKIIKDNYAQFKWQPYPTYANSKGKDHLSLLLGVKNMQLLFDLELKAFKTFLLNDKLVNKKNYTPIIPLY